LINHFTQSSPSLQRALSLLLVLPEGFSGNRFLDFLEFLFFLFYFKDNLEDGRFSLSPLHKFLTDLLA
jgi:hypothetical protein